MLMHTRRVHGGQIASPNFLQGFQRERVHVKDPRTGFVFKVLHYATEPRFPIAMPARSPWGHLCLGGRLFW